MTNENFLQNALQEAGLVAQRWGSECLGIEHLTYACLKTLIAEETIRPELATTLKAAAPASLLDSMTRAFATQMVVKPGPIPFTPLAREAFIMARDAAKVRDENITAWQFVVLLVGLARARKHRLLEVVPELASLG